MTTKTLFKDTLFIVLFSVLLLVSVLSLGIIPAVYRTFSKTNIFDSDKSIFTELYQYFYGHQMPKLKVVTNGITIKVLVKERFLPWREAKNEEFYVDMSKNTKSYLLNLNIQERATESLKMVKDHFKYRKFTDMNLVSETQLYKALNNDEDDDGN